MAVLRFYIVSLFISISSLVIAQPKNQVDSISFALGQELGLSFKQYDIAIGPQAFLQGLETVLKKRNPALSDEEVNELILDLQRELRERSNAIEEAITPANGSLAPEIAMASPSGDTLRLSSFKGRVVLIDFWASWCRPCRIENPKLVKLYQKYHEKGLEILGVSMDLEKDSWVEAIEKDQLGWQHVSDLSVPSAAAILYGVEAIPYSFLVDKNGMILAQNLRGEELTAVLMEIFGF